MMSDPASEDVPPHYETLISKTSFAVPSVVPASNAPVESFFQNVSPPPPTFYIPPSTQTWSFPTVAPQWQLSAIIPQNMDPSLPFFQTFLKGEPKAFGILVIVAAILEIGLGIGLTFTNFNITFPSGISFWGPVFYIIAGTLTLAAQQKPNICLIKGSLSLNIISSIFSMVAVILNIADLINVHCCRYRPSNGGYVVFLLLVTNLLLFCVTVSTSVFGCRSLSKAQSVTQVYMLPNDVVLDMNRGAVPIPIPVSTTYAQPSPQPPAYTVN